jgi:hypothetical protein
MQKLNAAPQIVMMLEEPENDAEASARDLVQQVGAGVVME